MTRRRDGREHRVRREVIGAVIRYAPHRVDRDVVVGIAVARDWHGVPGAVRVRREKSDSDRSEIPHRERKSTTSNRDRVRSRLLFTLRFRGRGFSKGVHPVGATNGWMRQHTRETTPLPEEKGFLRNSNFKRVRSRVAFDYT